MHITMTKVANAVSEYTEISVDMMKRPGRGTRDIVTARQCAMYLMYCLVPSISYPQIAKFFKRNHTTVLNARKAISDTMHYSDVSDIIEHVNGKFKRKGKIGANAMEIARLRRKITALKRQIKKLTNERIVLHPVNTKVA